MRGPRDFPYIVRTVIVLAFAIWAFKVTLAVAFTIYALSGPTSLMQAVALAKGIDPKLANLRKVAVIRTVNSKRVAGMFDLGAIREGRTPCYLVFRRS